MLKNQKKVLWIVTMMLLSTFAGLGLNTQAQPDNVWVEGYVLENGTFNPIGSASIILQNTQDRTTKSTTTNSTGYYNISIYAPPTWEIFELIAFHPDYLMNSTYIWLSEGNNQTDQNITLDPAGNRNSDVHGYVYDALTRAPLAFTGVGAVSDFYINTTSTNATGYYHMALESDHDYYIQVSLAGYQTQTKSARFGFGENKSFNFYLEPVNCTLSGFVNNPGGPLGSASVLVYQLGEQQPTQYWPQVNMSTGYFEVNLTRGVWQVEVEEGMHFSQTLSVIMENGKTTWQNFTLDKLPIERATVQGYITYYHNGSLVPNANIHSQNQNRTWQQDNSSDGAGWYSISVLPGDITLDVWWNMYGSKQIALTTQAAGVYDLNITVVDWNSKSFIEGYVRENGTSMPGVQIIVNFGNWRNQQMTDLTGHYNISTIAAPMELYAVAQDYKTAFEQVDTTDGQTSFLDIDLELLDYTCELRGYINNTNGEPVEGYVSIDYDGPGWQSATTITDYTGFYQMMAPAGGASYFLFAEKHEYTNGDLTLPSNQIYWFNETLTPIKEEARVIATFTDIYSGKPLKNTEIRISVMDHYLFMNKVTNSNGMIKADIPSGFVGISIEAWGNGYRNPGMFSDPSKMQFLLKPAETLWLNISLFPRQMRSVFSGYVNDTNPIPAPIVGAEVFVQYGGRIVSNITDASGNYALQLPGDQWVNSWVRAPGYKIAEYGTWVQDYFSLQYDWVLEASPAWIEGPITDSAADLDGDMQYDVLYVNVTVNVSQAGSYILDAYLAESRNSNQGIAGAEANFGTSTGLQVITLTFLGEQIRNSKKDGYFVNIDLRDDATWEKFDRAEYTTKPYTHSDFDQPNAAITTPVQQWLVDSDMDGLYNYLVLNVTINVSVAGDYTVLGPMRDIWGNEFAMAYETFYLEAGLQQVQITYEGTEIYNNGETIGSVFLVLFAGFPQEGSNYIHSLFLYTPYRYDIFQFYTIDAFVSGYVTDIYDQPIEGIYVWLYNISKRYLNETTTNATGYFELGGWSGDWVLVVNDEDDGNNYQGDLVEITLALGMNTHDFLKLPYTMLDHIETKLIFSDWNNTVLDWMLYAIGDNKTIRFDMDVRQFGNGDGFVSEEEVDYVMGMLNTLNLPASSNESFLVDGIWYDLNPSSVTRDAGLVGSITSTDPVYIHLTGDYISNTTIPDPSPHDLTLNCTYDDTDSGNFIGNNVTHVFYITTPSGWGRTGQGVPLNVTISGSDYITVDPLGDPNPGDSDISEWVNMTISSGELPTVGTIKGNVTLQGGSVHSGVTVTVYQNGTTTEIGWGHTDPDGYYEVPGLAPGDYDVVAQKAGYNDNWSFNVILAAGETLWIDFTLYSFPPQITHNPILTALMGNAIEVVAEVTDDGAVDEVILYYKDVGSGSYSFVTMSKIPSTSTYMGSIPAQSQVGFVYYYLWANDTKGNWAQNPVTGNYSIWVFELTPPDISVVTVSPDPSEYPEAVNISAMVTDGYFVSTVWLLVEYPDLSTTNVSMEKDPISGRYYTDFSYSMLGTYNFTIFANDTLDNWNFYLGSFEVRDSTAPSSSLDLLASYWFSSQITVTAQANDGGIGVANVTLYYRYSPDNGTTPWGNWTAFGTDSASPWSFTFTFPEGDGYYQFFSIAADTEANFEAMKVSAEIICALDSSLPSSTVNTISQYWQSQSPLVITAVALDPFGIGLDRVALWYKYSPDDINWDSPVEFSVDTQAPWSYDFTFPKGNGYYEFYSIARDLLGNTELAPSTADTECAFDNQKPEITSISITPDPAQLGQSITISVELSDVSGINGAWVQITLGTQDVGNFSLTLSGGDYEYVYTPQDIGTATFTFWVADAMGNWNTTSDSAEVIDTTLPVIGDFTLTPSNPQVKSTVTIKVNVSDASGVSQVYINITDPDGNFVLNESMTYESSSGRYTHETEYDVLGEYQVKIWAVDENGLWVVHEDTLTTRDTQPPNAVAGPSQQVTSGTQVTLDGGDSTDNYGIANYTWEFNDNGLKRLYGISVQYTFATPADYEITLKVKDFGDNVNEAKTWVNVSAVSGVGTVTGTVLDEKGNPVSGVQVYVEGRPDIQDVTDSRGVFVLSDVPVGQRIIWFVKDGYKRESTSVNVLQDQTATVPDFEIAKKGTKESAPVALYGILAAIIAIVVVILIFLMTRRKPQAVPLEETVIDEVFFMYNDGRLIKHFTRRLRPDMDEDILSGMLVAVQDFVKDSFKDSEASLDQITFGRFQVLLGRGEHIILATLIEGGDAAQFKPQVAQCVNDIEENFGDVLSQWDGDINRLKGAAKYVMDLIDGKYVQSE